MLQRLRKTRAQGDPTTWASATAGLLLAASAFVAAPAYSQTVAHPILIEVAAAHPTVAAGEQSALVITFRIPSGFWLGDNDRSARIPAPTLVYPIDHDGFTFGQPRFPDSEVRGVPVHLGTTRVFEGEITAIVPFRVAEGTTAGDYELGVELTYTPGLSAGHLSSHAREPYAAAVTVVAAGTAVDNTALPEPSRAQIPGDFLVEPRTPNLPQPLQSMFHIWDDEGAVARFFHGLFLDKGATGKKIRTIWHPATESSKNTGDSIGLGVSLMDVTREGIMTGMFDISVFDNEYVGTTATFDLLSCPCAYFNYHLSGEISEDRNKQLHLHVENMTLGKNNRHGFELQIDAFQDPRYRFYGLGAGTQEENGSNYAHEEFGGYLDVYWLPSDHLRLSVGGKVRSVDVKRGADKLVGILPFTIDLPEFAGVAGITGATVVGGRVNVVYDARNQEFTPSSGTYGKFTAEFNHVSDDPASVENYGRFSLQLRKYVSSVDQKYTLVLRNSWTITTDSDVPFFDQASLGGQATLRAFDQGRFLAQNSVYASAELRVQMLHMFILGSPMDLELSPFLDVGQVFDGTDFNGEVNVNPGLSMRFLNRPNIGLIINVANGQDGLLLTGGLSLPF